MGFQLYGVAYKRRTSVKTKSGKNKDKWVTEFRAPRLGDDNSEYISNALQEKISQWEVFGLIPTEAVPEGLKTSEPLRYGMRMWRDLFSPRQLLCHGLSVEVFRELLQEELAKGALNEVATAAFVYLAFALDKLVDRNSRMTRWIPQRAVIANTFDTHDFSIKWSFAEMPLLLQGTGYEWALYQVRKSVRELIELSRGVDLPASASSTQMELHPDAQQFSPPKLDLSTKSADCLDQIMDSSLDCIVIDPPYYDNVMYAELSDFFYVWLKRTAGQVLPELFAPC